MQYCSNLYRTIANFRINEMVEVSNRHGHKKTIHITNITNLSWNELQLLVASGSSRFDKIVHLYNHYSQKSTQSVVRGNELPKEVQIEIQKFIEIFQSQQFDFHYEVCEYISMNNWWSEFPNIRAINDHVKVEGVEGIEPKYFAMICKFLDLNEFRGSKLVKSTKY